MYMSPEQARGDVVDARSDIYSVSAMLYAMLAGRDPFEGHTSSAVLKRVLSGDFAPLNKVNPQVPKLLATIVERGMALAPRRRIDSAEEFAELLHPFISGGTSVVSLGPQRRAASDPIPLVTAQREVKIQGTLNPDGAPRESSVIPIRVASYDRGVTALGKLPSLGGRQRFHAPPGRAGLGRSQPTASLHAGAHRASHRAQRLARNPRDGHRLRTRRDHRLAERRALSRRRRHQGPARPFIGCSRNWSERI
jgi:serine/threonine protein kinase